ncbi:hypothetical protein Tco_0126699 [Tanacetum coccineum]
MLLAILAEALICAQDWLRSTPADLQDMPINGLPLEEMVENLEKLELVFDDKAYSLGLEHTQNLSPNEKENSSDPFNLYNLLNKRDKDEANSGLDSSIPFPPGFTPEREFQHVDAQEVQGGSILKVIDDMIKVGQSMGFTMEGCLGSNAKKDWIKELNNKHKVNFLSVQETKLDCISDMDVKVLWGNYKFEYTISEAVGNSGGILCVWDPSVFRKEHHVVSDNFVALSSIRQLTPN